MKAIHVATVPPELDPMMLDTVLGGLESALLQIGADRIWIAPGLPALAVMAELPDRRTRTPSSGHVDARARKDDSC